MRARVGADLGASFGETAQAVPRQRGELVPAVLPETDRAAAALTAAPSAAYSVQAKTVGRSAELLQHR